MMWPLASVFLLCSFGNVSSSLMSRRALYKPIGSLKCSWISLRHSLLPMTSKRRKRSGTAYATIGNEVPITSVLFSPKNTSALPTGARFVDVDAYVAAGGTLERDLFDEENEGY